MRISFFIAEFSLPVFSCSLSPLENDITVDNFMKSPGVELPVFAYHLAISLPRKNQRSCESSFTLSESLRPLLRVLF